MDVFKPVRRFVVNGAVITDRLLRRFHQLAFFNRVLHIFFGVFGERVRFIAAEVDFTTWIVSTLVSTEISKEAYDGQ